MTCPMPDYQYAFDRIDLFENEQEDWDGCDGLPASPAVAAEVRTFLTAAQKEGIEVPSLAMGGDGSVAVIWNGHGMYISADFDGTPEYSFLVSRGDGFLDSGVCSSSRVAECLIKYLKDDFLDKQ